MSENPLLPHRKLRELHTLMLRCRDLERKQKFRGAARDALLAATSIHLLSGDLISARAEDQTPLHLAPEGKKPNLTGGLVTAPSIASRLTACAATARGLQAAGSDGVVLAMTQAGTKEAGWQAALDWAQQAQLPLLLACADATRGPARATAGSRGEPALDFATISRFAKRNQLPVLTVDGEDAVAVYRVMQESVLRARLGGGPAVLWAVLTPLAGAQAKLSRAQQPIVKLERYMAARKISLKA